MSRIGREAASFGHAVAGIWRAVREEPHMRFHLLAAAAAAALGWALDIPRADWLWIAAAIAAVWTAELVNTAIERTVDLATQERRPLARDAKDAAAGAALVASVFAAVVGALVLGPPLWERLFG